MDSIEDVMKNNTEDEYLYFDKKLIHFNWLHNFDYYDYEFILHIIRYSVHRIKIVFSIL